MKQLTPPLYHQTYLNVGDGPVVILLHGLFGNIAMWKSTVEALKAKHRVVIPRLPIFDLPIEHTNVKYLAKVLHDFIDWHHFSNVTIVGHAIGGQLALLYSAEHPANVNRIVLTSSTGLFDHSPFTQGHSSGFNDLEFIQEKVQSAFYQPGNAPKALVEEVYSTVKSIPKRLTLGELSKSSGKNNVAPLLNKLSHPVLLIWGLDDKMTPPEVAL
ncbi:MAG: alpha/beta hydrolase, partial [Cytophagia bacterium]|nr:alpha/beta hydrolase [Cytophagia bacterium]